MTETGVIIGWPKLEPGCGRTEHEFLVLKRVYPDFPYFERNKFIAESEKTGKYRKVVFVPIEPEEK